MITEKSNKVYKITNCIQAGKNIISILIILLFLFLHDILISHKQNTLFIYFMQDALRRITLY